MFELPKASEKREVRLGRTSRYFEYDENKKLIYKIDEQEVLPFGFYKV